MILKFYARDDLLVTEPGTTQYAGQLARYIGRSWDKTLYGYPATKEPFCVDSNSPTGARLLKLMLREQSLWPADEATAAACGMSLTKLSFTSGVWLPAKASGKGND